MATQEETYIGIMIQSLEKKTRVLDEIIRWDEKQKEVLENPEATPDEFDETVDAKSTLIEQLEQLDSGFEKLYERVQQEMKDNKEAHKEEIKKLQGLIRGITDRSVQIQAQEARNKELMTLKFARIKSQAKQIRANAGATAKYYQSMSRANFIDPQFLDNKQ